MDYGGLIKKKTVSTDGFSAQLQWSLLFSVFSRYVTWPNTGGLGSTPGFANFTEVSNLVPQLPVSCEFFKRNTHI